MKSCNYDVMNETADKGQALTIKVPLFFDDGAVNAVRGIVREYRYVARKAAAQYACMDIATHDMRLNEKGYLEPLKKITGKQDTANVAALAKAIFSSPDMRRGDGGLYATPLDGAVKAIAPDNWSVESIQMCSREVLSRWHAKDPDKGIPLKYLIRSAERKPTSFFHALFPILFCTSKCSNLDFGGPVTLNTYDVESKSVKPREFRGSITLRIHGESFRAGIGAIDGYRHRIICGLNRFVMGEEKSIEPAGAKLKLDDKGRLSLILGFYAPVKMVRKSNLERAVEVGFDEENIDKFIQCRLDTGHQPSDDKPLDEIRNTVISVYACIAALDRNKMQSKRAERERNSSLNHDIARKSLRERGARLQARRTNISKSWCHQWTHEIVRFTRSMNAGRIVVRGLPKTIQERPFLWSNFIFDLEYKAKLEGMTVVVEKPVEV